MLDEFAGALAGWEWDVALLQEVPPWWPPLLGAACGASARWVLTSRNFGLAARRAVSARNPDLLKANGGGCNAILVRGPVADHRVVRLTWWPERRWAHGVRVGEWWVVNLHASTHRDEWALRDTLRALDAARGWASGAPLLFGGDVNLRRPVLPGMTWLGGNHVDHLFSSGAPGASVRGARARPALRPSTDPRHPLSPKPRSISIARSPAVPGLGSDAERHRGGVDVEERADAEQPPLVVELGVDDGVDLDRPVRRVDAAEVALVRAEDAAGRADERAVGQAGAGRVHPRVRQRLPQLARVAGQRAGPDQRLGRERVLVVDVRVADGFEPARIAARPHAVPCVEELVRFHARHDG